VRDQSAGCEITKDRAMQLGPDARAPRTMDTMANDDDDHSDNDESYNPEPSVVRSLPQTLPAQSPLTPRTQRRSTRTAAKRRKTTTGKPRPAKRKRLSSPLPSPNPPAPLQPLLDALTARYADADAHDGAFEDALAPLLDDCLRARRDYLSSLPSDDTVRHLSPLSFRTGN
jgi:hypothetical protein